MLLKLFALFVIVPLVELMLLLQLSEHTHPLFALAVVVVTGLVGSWLARSQGWKTLRRIQLALSQGQLPTEALLDAAMIFCAGALLLTPGMLTDAVGVSLLIPLCRRWYRRRLMAWIRRNFQVVTTPGAAPEARSRIIDSYVVDPPASDHPPKQDPP